MSLDLEGIIPALVTPFTDDEEIDAEAMRREVRYMLDAGVHGLTVTGSTGEGQTLTLDESCRIAQVAIEETHGAVPVVAGIIQDSTRAVIRYGRALKEVGVDALQITPVHYLFAPGPEGTLAYYTEISRAVQLPLIIYNVVPWHPISPATVLRLAEVEGVVAVKQSGGDIHALADLLQAVRATGSGLRVLTAVDALLYPSFLLGAHVCWGPTESWWRSWRWRHGWAWSCGRPASSVTSTAPVRSTNGCCRYGACWRRRTCPRA